MVGPPVNLTAWNFKDAKLPVNGTIQLQFDRFLKPITVNRQSLVLRDGGGGPVNPVVSYDPVARVVTLSCQRDPKNGAVCDAGWLKPDQPYKLEVHSPTGNEDNGIRAIDNAPLAPVADLGFLTDKDPGAPFTPEPAADFCRDVLPIFQRSCTAPICHGSPAPSNDKRFGDRGTSAPAAGLVLETAEGVRSTAIGRVANGANTGARAAATEPGRVFGVDMPIVTPPNGKEPETGGPGNSWMMYKLLLATPGDPAKVKEAARPKCDGTPGTPPLGPLALPAPLVAGVTDDAQRGFLSDYVIGREMPYPDMGPDGPHDTNPGLTYGELERVRLWIAQGAHVNDCGACEP